MDLDLDAVNPADLERVLSEAELNKSKQDVKDLVQLYQQNELDIKKFKQHIQKARSRINVIEELTTTTGKKKVMKVKSLGEIQKK